MMDTQTNFDFRKLWDSIPETESAESRDAFSLFSKSIGGFPRRDRGRLWVSLALSISILFASTVFLSRLFVKNEMEYLEVAVAMASRDTVILPDNTKVILNSGSKLLFPNHFARKERRVFLYGEGFFDVTSNPDVPFIVCSGNVRAQVYGTEFNMNTYDNLEEVSIGLISGKMAVEAKSRNGVSRIMLNPGDVVRYNKKESRLYNTSYIPNAECLWTSGDHCFIDQSLSEIAKQLERDFNCRIIVSNDIVNKRHFTMAFVNNESLEQILKAISINCQIEYKHLNDIYILN